MGTVFKMTTLLDKTYSPPRFWEQERCKMCLLNSKEKAKACSLPIFGPLKATKILAHQYREKTRSSASSGLREIQKISHSDIYFRAKNICLSTLVVRPFSCQSASFSSSSMSECPSRVMFVLKKPNFPTDRYGKPLSQ